jgi:hypothetical protein
LWNSVLCPFLMHVICFSHGLFTLIVFIEGSRVWDTSCNFCLGIQICCRTSSFRVLCTHGLHIIWRSSFSLILDNWYWAVYF